MSWEVRLANQAGKDRKKITAELNPAVDRLLDIIREDPFRTPPPYKKMKGRMAGSYSRRINRQHRLVYQVISEKQTVRILRMWGHYE